MKQTKIVLTNLPAIGMLAARAGRSDWKEWKDYADGLLETLERKGMITDDNAGMRMADALAEVSAMDVIRVLKESGIETPNFDDLEYLNLIYLHPEKQAEFTDMLGGEKCPRCGEQADFVSGQCPWCGNLI